MKVSPNRVEPSARHRFYAVYSFCQIGLRAPLNLTKA